MDINDALDYLNNGNRLHQKIDVFNSDEEFALSIE